MEEMEPCCVLDFYVHESSQRGGWGSLLFDAFLQREDRHPARLAYDRPSPKLVAFMAKHHNLRAFAKQNNNFVVFDEYWSEEVRNFGVARARNGGRPETARVGGREGLGAAARKRAEAARRAAAELEQRRKPPETSGNFLKPARPTGSFGFQRQQQQQQDWQQQQQQQQQQQLQQQQEQQQQQHWQQQQQHRQHQQQQQQHPMRSPAAAAAADASSSRWTPVSQRPLTAARPSFGRRASGGRTSSREGREEDDRDRASPTGVAEYRVARPPSHGSRPPRYAAAAADDDDDGDGVALFDEGARRDSPKDWTNERAALDEGDRPGSGREIPWHGRRAAPSSPPRQYHHQQQQQQQQQHHQQQQQQPLRYPRAPPSASSNLTDRPGVLSSDYSARYAAFVAGLRDVETRERERTANEANDLLKRDVENLRVVNGVYQPGTSAGYGAGGGGVGVGHGMDVSRRLPGHWRSDEKPAAHNGYRVRRDGFDRDVTVNPGANVNKPPAAAGLHQQQWGRGDDRIWSSDRKGDTAFGARNRWDQARRMREAKETDARVSELAGLRGAPRAVPTPGEESRVVRYGRRATRDVY